MLFAVGLTAGERSRRRSRTRDRHNGRLCPPGQRWTFYEIDPAVIRLAHDSRYLQLLVDTRAAIQSVRATRVSH